MTIEQQLRTDIEARIQERLVRWRMDSVALYEMANLDPVETAKDIFVCLLGEVIHLTLALDLPPELVSQSITEVTNKVKAKRAAEGRSYD